MTKIAPDGQRLWGDGGEVIMAGNMSAHPIQLAADGTGGCYVTWASMSPEGVVRLQRVSAQGDTLFPAAGVSVVNGGYYVNDVTIAPSRSDDLIEGC